MENNTKMACLSPNKRRLTTSLIFIVLCSCIATISQEDNFAINARRVQSRRGQDDGNMVGNTKEKRINAMVENNTLPSLRSEDVLRFVRSSRPFGLFLLMWQRFGGRRGVESAVRGDRPLQRFLQFLLRRGVNDRKEDAKVNDDNTALVPNARFIRPGVDVLYDRGEPVPFAVISMMAFVVYNFFGGLFFAGFLIVIQALPLFGLQPLIGSRFTDILHVFKQTSDVVRRVDGEETRGIKVEDARNLVKVFQSSENDKNSSGETLEKNIFDRSGFTEVTVDESLRSLDWKLFEKYVYFKHAGFLINKDTPHGSWEPSEAEKAQLANIAVSLIVDKLQPNIPNI